MSSQIQGQVTQLQNNTNRINFVKGQENLGSQSLDKNAFLRLLMAQLQNQDPLSPVDNKDFLAQQAQLTQVEKLDTLVQAVTTGNNLSQISGLVGKRVDIKTSAGQTITGLVASGSVSDGRAALDVGGVSYPIDQITKVYG